MSPFRYRDEESSSTGMIIGVLAGAVAGIAVGMLVAQRVGGLSGLKEMTGGLTAKLRRREAIGGGEGGMTEATLRERYAAGEEEDVEEFDDIEGDDFESGDYDSGLEEHVLEAFRNDPILSERAVDIGSIGEGVIELAGWVEDEGEAQHAVTIARGVPGVDTVVNRIAIGDEERRFEEAAQRVRDGDPSLTEAHWEGSRVGTGRRRQGSSNEMDRHEDPRVPLEDRWNKADDALRNAAEDTEGLAERRARTKKAIKGDRTGGSPLAPTGVPKGDHVADPLEAQRIAEIDSSGANPSAAQIKSSDRY